MLVLYVFVIAIVIINWLSTKTLSAQIDALLAELRALRRNVAAPPPTDASLKQN